MSDNKNPYATPESNVSDPNQIITDTLILSSTSKSNSIGAAWGWIKFGFSNFKSSPLFWIINIILYGVIFIILSLIPFLGILLTSLLSPVFIGGLMLGTYAVSQGKPMTVNHLFAGFKKNTGSLVGVGLLYLLGIIVLLLATGLIAYLTGGFDGFKTLISSQSGGQADPTQVLAAYGKLKIAGIFYLIMSIPLMLSIIFSPALIVMHDVKTMNAMKQSFLGGIKNILPLIFWFFLSMILMFLGAIPFGLGLLVVIPMLTASLFAAYKTIFTD
jgi:uncharacterized membrane protein